MNQVLTRRENMGFVRRHRRHDTRSPIGRDFAHSRAASPARRWWAAVLVAGVLAALGVVHVRVRLIEEGYLRAAAVERVETLLAERQLLKARVEALRSPDRLTALAKERGFGTPEREIWLSQRTQRHQSTDPRPAEQRP